MPFSFKADGSLDKGDWDARKKTMPYGQVPVLEVDGLQIAQSGAIVRFLAKRLNLNGANDVEAALIDAQFEARGDMYKAFQTAKPDAASQLSSHRRLVTSTLPACVSAYAGPRFSIAFVVLLPFALCACVCVSELAEFWSKGLVEQLSYIERNVQGDLWIAKSNVMSYADIALYYMLYVFGRENKEAVDAALLTAPKVRCWSPHSRSGQRGGEQSRSRSMPHRGRC